MSGELANLHDTSLKSQVLAEALQVAASVKDGKDLASNPTLLESVEKVVDDIATKYDKPVDAFRGHEEVASNLARKVLDACMLVDANSSNRLLSMAESVIDWLEGSAKEPLAELLGQAADFHGLCASRARWMASGGDTAKRLKADGDHAILKEFLSRYAARTTTSLSYRRRSPLAGRHWARSKLLA